MSHGNENAVARGEGPDVRSSPVVPTVRPPAHHALGGAPVSVRIAAAHLTAS